MAPQQAEQLAEVVLCLDDSGLSRAHGVEQFSDAERAVAAAQREKQLQQSLQWIELFHHSISLRCGKPLPVGAELEQEFGIRRLLSVQLGERFGRSVRLIEDFQPVQKFTRARLLVQPSILA